MKTTTKATAIAGANGKPESLSLSKTELPTPIIQARKINSKNALVLKNRQHTAISLISPPPIDGFLVYFSNK